LEQYAPSVLYCAGILAFLLSIFWRPIVGIYYLVPLIPLQTVRYWLNGYPLGQSLVDITLLGVVLGLLLRGTPIFPKTPWNSLLLTYAIFTFVSLCYGSFYLGESLPLSLSDPRLAFWKDHMVMPMILFLVAATVRQPRQMKMLLILMCLSVLAMDRNLSATVVARDFSSFSYDLRDEGAMGYAGVNGLAAFEAQFTAFLLAMAGFELKPVWRLGYIALAAFSSICLMYSLSRGGYVALLVACLFIGLTKQRKLLVTILVLYLAAGWLVPNLVPIAVRQRVLMTYDENKGELDHSADVRLVLWEDAVHVFDSSPILGTGFNTYAYMGRVGSYRDTHNLFLKVLVETGVAGLLLFLWLLSKAFLVGYQLFRSARDPFLASLGHGLAAWVVCAAVANIFGDRWTFLQVNGYLWVIAGLVAGALVLEQSTAQAVAKESILTGKTARLLSALKPQTARAV
jgi:O-antigen ligase